MSATRTRRTRLSRNHARTGQRVSVLLNDGTVLDGKLVTWTTIVIEVRDDDLQLAERPAGMVSRVDAVFTTLTSPDTSRTHRFLISGCVNQWAGDHDHAHCWAAFLEFHGAPPGLGIDEFYDWLSRQTEGEQ
jgi:hypothetical protein